MEKNINAEEDILVLKNIKKSFGSNQVLSGIELTVKKGEFITLLGASGCGKTTTLRIIAGLEYPDDGCVELEGSDVTLLPPEKRNVNTVFQNYALFPHMNVYENIGYGLKIKGINKSEIKKRVSEMLELVQLSGFERRYPKEMSGGQMQRVAIARALVNNPKILLLDEPLGALDLQLRRQMQHELKRLQKKLGITFIYITHDQEEAINMSDRIAVMKDGNFVQIGTPREIYEKPRSSYVANFVGSANILSGKIDKVEDKRVHLISEDGSFFAKFNSDAYVSRKCKVAIRGENIQLSKERVEDSIRGKIVEKTYAGGMLRIVLSLKSSEIEVSKNGIDFDADIGDYVYAYWNYNDAILVDMEESYEKK